MKKRLLSIIISACLFCTMASCTSPSVPTTSSVMPDNTVSSQIAPSSENESPERAIRGDWFNEYNEKMRFGDGTASFTNSEGITSDQVYRIDGSQIYFAESTEKMEKLDGEAMEFSISSDTLTLNGDVFTRQKNEKPADPEIPADCLSGGEIMLFDDGFIINYNANTGTDTLHRLDGSEIDIGEFSRLELEPGEDSLEDVIITYKKDASGETRGCIRTDGSVLLAPIASIIHRVGDSLIYTAPDPKYGKTNTNGVIRISDGKEILPNEYSITSEAAVLNSVGGKQPGNYYKTVLAGYTLYKGSEESYADLNGQPTTKEALEKLCTDAHKPYSLLDTAPYSQFTDMTAAEQWIQANSCGDIQYSLPSVPNFFYRQKPWLSTPQAEPATGSIALLFPLQMKDNAYNVTMYGLLSSKGEVIVEPQYSKYTLVGYDAAGTVLTGWYLEDSDTQKGVLVDFNGKILHQGKLPGKLLNDNALLLGSVGDAESVLYDLQSGVSFQGAKKVMFHEHDKVLLVQNMDESWRLYVRDSAGTPKLVGSMACKTSSTGVLFPYSISTNKIAYVKESAKPNTDYVTYTILNLNTLEEEAAFPFSYIG